MAYIGRQLARGENKLFDDISSSFNGSTTVFNLTVSSVAISTATPFQLFVSLGGVMQKPNTDFTTAGNQITFTTAPAAGLSCWIMMQGDTIDQAAIPDASVSPSKIAGSGDFAFPADVRLKDGDGSHYVGFQSATTVSTSLVWTLPAADGTANQYLKTDGSGTLSWGSDSTSDPSKMPLAGGTFTGDVTFTGDASNGLWDKSASAFVANLTGNVTGNCSGTSGGFTAGSASNLNSGTVNTARLGSGSSITTKFLRGDNTWQTITGTTINNNADNRLITGSGTANTLEGEANLTFDGTNLDLPDSKKIRLGTGNDFELFHNGSHTYFAQTGDGNIFFKCSDVTFQSDDGSVTALAIDANGGITLKHANTTRIETSSSGATISGTCVASTFQGSGANLNSIPAGVLTGTLPAISGASLTSLNATNISSGTVAVARLGSGSPSSSNYLRGDGSWSSVSVSLTTSMLTSSTTTVSNSTGLGKNVSLPGGARNVLIGEDVLANFTGSGYGAYSSVMIGYQAGEGASSISGNIGDNVFIGYNSGHFVAGGAYYNTCVGAGSGLSNTGDNNVYIGSDAGYSATSGSNNVAIGKDAGNGNSPSGNIGASSGVVCLGNNNVTDLYCADTSISSSDKRDKTDIADFTHGLKWINQLKPVTYRWDKRTWYEEYNDDKTLKTAGTPDGSKKRARKHIGFLAQDVLAIEQADGFASKKDDMLVVNLNADDTAYGLKYERLVPVLVNAIKELSTEVTTLKNKVAALESALNDLLLPFPSSFVSSP